MLRFFDYITEITKSEQHLIDQANKHPQGLVSVTQKIGGTGTRHAKAADRLVQKGIMKRVDTGQQGNDREINKKSGKTHRYVTGSYRLNKE